MNTSAIKTFFSSSKFRQLRFGTLGVLVSAAMLMPTTALGWNYSNVPLFWVQGIKPNVALMLDDSGSMQAMTTNEAFQRANVDGTVPTTSWYWCSNYSGSKCTGYSSSKISDGFNVLEWNPPTINKSGLMTGSINVTANTFYKSVTASSGCAQGSDGLFGSSLPTSPATSSSKQNTYTATGICSDGYNLPEGAKITSISDAKYISWSSPSTPLYVVNASTYGFQLSTSLGGSPTNITVITTKTSKSISGSYQLDYSYDPKTYEAKLPSYISGKNISLCNVTKSPGSTGFYLGESGQTITSALSYLGLGGLPTADKVGVLVSDKASSGAHYACVRWKMASTGRTSANVPEGYDYSRYATGTNYNMDSNTPYGNFLLNTLLPTSGSVSANFDDSTQYPNSDTTGREWDTAKDKAVKDSGAATDNKYYIIPNLTRVEAAREAAQKVVLDFYDKLNLGLFHLNTSPRLIYAVPDGSAPTSDKQALISTTESMLPANLPASAIDGYIGQSGAAGGTPLAKTQLDINNYFQGALVKSSSGGWNPTYTYYSSPIQYRCQKNYAVVMTDGEPSSDSDTLDNRAQEGYDTDAKTSGNDADGKDWNDSTDDDKWKIQNVVTYTVGLGLENNLLKRAPLTDQVKVPKSNINIGGNNTIKLEKHGLTTGDYVQVLSDAAGGLKNTNYYYAVVEDASNFKLAGVRTSNTDSGDSGSSTTNNRQAVNNCKGGTDATTNGALGCMMVTNNGGNDMVLSTGPGKAFFSFTPDQLAADMGKVFNNINKITSSASAVSTNTKQFGGGGSGKELVYQARFNTEDWTGEVAAYEVVIVNGKASVDTSDTAIPFWTTKEEVADASDRKAGKMFTWNPSTPGGVDFTWGNLSAAQQTALGGATVGANVISWLQGNDVSGFRQHSIDHGLLGDILGADPVFFNYVNASYSKITASPGTCTIAGDNKSASGAGCTGAEIYSQYVTDGKTRTPMIYVGANDGMMHALDALSGEEMMTFIPNAVYTDGAENKFLNLTSPSYDHRYFVDGSAVVSDAFDGSNWHSYLLFGLGHGGKSVSAIDVTDTTYTASDIKWEFSNAELGYTYGTPVVARFADNKWYAIFSNGLDSASNKASVFVVNIADASDYRILTTGVGSAGTPNGMMSIQPKLNSERTVTDIYAGDIRGNVWKFDVYNEGTSSVQWNNGVNLFTTGAASTGTPQSITGGIRVGKHPTGAGSIIFFGTGKYFEVGDNTYNGASVPQVDSLYAVLDNETTTGLTRSQLKKQEFTMLGTNLRTASQNSVSYSGSEMGWYIDLLNGTGGNVGERIVSTPLLSGGRIIFASIIPSAGATCGGEGTSYLNELDAFTGGMLKDKVLDTNGDGKIDGDDEQVSSVQLGGLISDPSIVGGQDRDYKVIGSTGGGGSVQILSETKTGSGDESGIPKGRVSWQQLQ